MTPAIKICCIASPEEAALAIHCGASALGLVSSMPSGPGVIDETTIATIAAAVPTPTRTFLLTSLTSPDKIIAQHQRCRTTTLQLCDHLEPETHLALRDALPNVELVQVVHVIDPTSIDYARWIYPYVDAILLDSGNPNAQVKSLGGTGQTHDWSLSKRIRESCPLPVYLAGGINPQNVRHAIEIVQPYGLDLCSSVREEGRLSPTLLRQFFQAVHHS